MSLSALPFDPIKGTEIMDLVGAPEVYLQVPKFYNQLKEITSFFSNKPNYRYLILRITSGKQDKLDALWAYVQLENERSASLSKLDVKDFEPDIAQEIVDKHLTKNSRQILRVDLAKRREESKQRRNQEAFQKKQDKALDKVFAQDKFDLYENVLDSLDQIDKELEINGLC